MLWPGIAFAAASRCRTCRSAGRAGAPRRARRARPGSARPSSRRSPACRARTASRRAPDPVRDDRVDQREGGAEGEVDPELGALGHRAPDDRQRDAGEDDLEQVAGGAGIVVKNESNGACPIASQRRRPTARTRCVPTKRVAVAEGDPEADRPVDERADGEDEHVLAGDVARRSSSASAPPRGRRTRPA